MRYWLKLIYIFSIFAFIKVRRLFFFNEKKMVRVIILHDLSHDEILKLDKVVLKLSETWDFISPKDFIEYNLGRFPLKRRSILFTFDDGFLSSKTAAETVLMPKGIDSLFFISPGFIDTANDDEKSLHYLNAALKIRTEESRDELRPMNWTQVHELHEAGQLIGSHTINHKAISKCSYDELLIELKEGRTRLENELNGVEVTEFAFPFGHAKSVCVSSHDESLKYYSNIYSGFRGRNYPHAKKGLIMRDAINLKDPLFFIEVYLEGMLDAQYKPVIEKMIRTK